LWTSQLVEMFDGKFGVNNHAQCDFEKFAIHKLIRSVVTTETVNNI